jgi:Leucine-rich repeat (LRR) protein
MMNENLESSFLIKAESPLFNQAMITLIKDFQNKDLSQYAKEDLRVDDTDAVERFKQIVTMFSKYNNIVGTKSCRFKTIIGLNNVHAVSLDENNQIIWTNKYDVACILKGDYNFGYDVQVEKYLKQINSAYFTKLDYIRLSFKLAPQEEIWQEKNKIMDQLRSVFVLSEEDLIMLKLDDSMQILISPLFYIMKWVNGVTLGEYLQLNHKKPSLITELANKFLALTDWLHEQKISHGDLSDSNIMVNQYGNLVLVDYDSLCFAEIEGKYSYMVTEDQAHYQHPSFMQEKRHDLSLKADYFSELVIYLSLIALAENPALFSYVSVGEHLLFTQDDFADINNSKIMSELAKLSPRVQNLVKILKFYLKNDNFLKLIPFRQIFEQIAPFSLKDNYLEELDLFYGYYIGGHITKDQIYLHFNYEGGPASICCNDFESEFTKAKTWFLAVLPDIGRLDQLEDLSFAYSRVDNGYGDSAYLPIMELPDSFQYLFNLKKLNCDTNELTQIPEWIGDLTNLQYLNFQNNKLTKLPDSIGNLTDLTVFSCSNNPLTKLPDAIGNLTNLTTFSCSNNNLTKLPDSMMKLTNLQEFHCENNQLTELPEWINQLTKLEKIYCDQVVIDKLPEHLQKIASTPK